MTVNLDLIRGRQQVIPLTNMSGAERVEGEVVVVDVANDRSFTGTTTPGDKTVIGVVAETIAAAEEGRVICSGYAPIVEVDATTDRGDFLKTSSTVGKATPSSSPQEGCFAIALSPCISADQVSAFIFPGGAALLAGTSPAGVLVLTARGGAPREDSGCADPTKYEIGTVNHIDKYVLGFDKDADEYAQWSEIVMPTDWDGGTVTALFVWTCNTGVGSGAETVCFALKGRSWGDDEAIDQALGAAQAVTDTWLADKDVHISAESAAITLAGTPAAGELVTFEVMRDVSEDDLGGDAWLISVLVAYGRT